MKDNSTYIHKVVLTFFGVSSSDISSYTRYILSKDNVLSLVVYPDVEETRITRVVVKKFVSKQTIIGIGYKHAQVSDPVGLPKDMYVAYRLVKGTKADKN
jgi:hypothetical protein